MQAGRFAREDHHISEHIASAQDPESARLNAVERYRVISVPQDAVMTRLARLAARFFDAPMATVTMINGTHTWFTATHGFDLPLAPQPRDDGLCVETVVRGGPNVVANIAADARFADRAFAVEHGIAFFACAPIVTFDGERIGAVMVCDTTPRTATAEQVGVLNDLAAIVMEQFELRLSLLHVVRDERQLRDEAEFARTDAEYDRDTARHDLDIAERERDSVEEYATVLQKTLLPPSLPLISGLSLAAHYHPASPRQVGGDFYDVFGLGGDRWSFFIGDVEGHGADAAAATSLVRYTLRSAALHYTGCTEVLAEVNEVLLREMQPRRLCTVLYGTIARSATGVDMVLATGGHQPGLLIDPARGSVEVVRSDTGILLGATPNASFGTLDVPVAPGQILLLFTDGIVEARRGEAPFDVDRLAEFALEHANAGVRALVDDLATLIPKLDPGDDVALLAFEVR